MVKFGTHNKAANEQASSQWPPLLTFWSTVGQFHPPPPPERKPCDTQLLQLFADKYRDNLMTPFHRDFFNRQDKAYLRLVVHYGWPNGRDDAIKYRRTANTNQNQLHHPAIAHNDMPERKFDERWLGQHYGLAVYIHSHITCMLVHIEEAGCGYALAPLARLNHKRVPMDSSIWKH